MNTKKTIFSLLIGAGMMSGINAQSLQSAIAKTDQERFEEAISEFQGITAKEPNNGDNWFYFGETYFKRASLDDFKSADVDSAMMMYKKGFEINSTNPLPYIGMGKVYLVQGNEKEANTNLYKAGTLIDPKKPNPVHKLRLAEAYLAVPKFRNPDEAMKILESIAKSEGKNPEYWIIRGDAIFYKNSGNAGEAVKSYEKAYELNPKSSRAILKQGKIYKMARNEKLGLEYYQKAVKADSLFAPAYREIAELYHQFGYDAKALEYYEKYVRFNNSDGARKRLIEFMFLMKQYKEVIPMILELQAKGMKSCYLWRYLGYSYYEAGEKFDKDAYKKGLDAMESFFTCAGPEFKYFSTDYKYKGLLMSKAYKDSVPMLNKAIDEMKRAIAIDPQENCELWGDVGMIQMRMDSFADVIESYSSKMKCTELRGQDYYNLGRAYYFAKDYKMADSTFAMLVKAVPTNPLGTFWRARASAMLDPKNEQRLAKPHYEVYFNMIKAEDRGTPSNKPNVVEALDFLTNDAIKYNENDKAKEHLGILEQVDPKNAKIPTFKKILGPGTKKPAPGGQ